MSLSFESPFKPRARPTSPTASPTAPAQERESTTPMRVIRLETLTPSRLRPPLVERQPTREEQLAEWRRQKAAREQPDDKENASPPRASSSKPLAQARSTKKSRGLRVRFAGAPAWVYWLAHVVAQSHARPMDDGADPYGIDGVCYEVAVTDGSSAERATTTGTNVG